jgi:type IV pilus assembly protein PilN
VIRVNLLPQKRETKREAGQGWLLAVLGVMLIEIIGLFFFHRQKQEELEKQKRTNAELSSQIEQIKKTVANHGEIKAQLESLRQREDAINKLQSARTGPTAVLLEVARILTKGQMPTVDQDFLQQQRRDNPTAVPNLNWDSRRLWLVGYGDTERLVKMEGLARDGDDVSELARRLTFSKYFTDVKLLPATKTHDTASHLDVMHFELSAKAKY